MNYKIINGTLLTHTEKGFEIEKKDLYVAEGKIVDPARCEGWKEGGYETVDARDRLVMPGLINMHTHAYMTMMRN